MKLIISEIVLLSLLIVTLTNWTISNRPLNLAESKYELTDFDKLANAMNQMNGAPANEKVV